jgi:acyl-coenzyme A thioesterase PaaI-like protein
MSTPAPTPDADELPPDVVASRRCAAATRRVARALVEAQPPAAVLDAAAVELETLAGRLEAYPEANEEALGVGFTWQLDWARLERHPFLGRSNPLAPPVVLEPDGDDGSVVASVVFDARHRGGHGQAHGGWVAALFDQVLAVAGARAAGGPTVTGTLTVRYEAPTPIGRELRLTARATRAGDRTLRARGTLRAGTTETATGEAVLVAPRASDEPGPASR